MTRAASSIPTAILVAGAMVASAVYFRPGEGRRQGVEVDPIAVGDSSSQQAPGAPPQQPAPEKSFPSSEVKALDAPAKEVDLRPIMDAWEKYWNPPNQEFRVHGGII